MTVVDLSGGIVWPFRGEPHVRVPGGQQITVDPFPGYAHDRALVEECFEAVQRAFPIAHPPMVYLLDREPPARTNGWAEPDSEYDRDAERWHPSPGRIVLAGKRIPLHPAMTRYLVAHEYGHHVEWELAWRRTKPEIEYDALRAEYLDLRGLDPDHLHATGGTWHKSVVDVFADDFRVLVARAEREFWPHPGIARPETCPAVLEWWSDACGIAS